MKTYKHLFNSEIHRLKHLLSVNPDDEDNRFMLKFMEDAAAMDINKLSKDLQKCVDSWPCIKTMTIMMMWLLLRDNERRSKQAV